MKSFSIAISAIGAICATQKLYADSSFDGSLELQHRQFFEKETVGDVSGQSSAKLELEFFLDWNDGADRLEIQPFVRLDSVDDERTHADLRQFIWTHLGDNYEFSAGIGKVFWGVTETQHLVDIINQTDGVENIDGEDKLGQAMLRYQYLGDFGTVDAYLLPYFRERSFEGRDGRLNAGLLVDTDNAIYESNSEQSNLDYALRYSNSIGSWDLGLSWFSGTSREPDLLRNLDFATGSTRPFYPQIDQFGADIQLTTGGWLLKLEGIQRNFNDAFYEDYAAVTTGFEYTLVGVLGSAYDVGLLGEYSWDERDQLASSLFQNDVFFGARLVLNDISDSQFLLGFSNDLDNSDSRTLFLEGNTRIGNQLSLNIELRYFTSDTPRDPLFRFRDDSFIQIGLEYYFN